MTNLEASARRDLPHSVAAPAADATAGKAAARGRVSIAMATYNGEKYLAEQLQSLAQQTLLPFELVITDDASVDRTLQIIEDFRGDAPFPVRVFPNEKRLGVTRNFFKAARLCEGELVGFCDQDDVWLPEKLKTVSEYFKNPANILVVHSALVSNSVLEVGSRRCPDFLKTIDLSVTEFDPYFSAWGCCMVFRKEIVALIDYLMSKPDAPEFLHDTWMQSIAPAFGNTVLLKDNLSIYRQHENNVAGAAPEMQKPALKQDNAGLYNALMNKHRHFAVIADCFAALEQGPFDQRRRQAAVARAHWQRVSANFGARAEIYNQQRRLSYSAGQWAQLALRGGYYKRNKGRFGLRSLLLDGISLSYRAMRASRQLRRQGRRYGEN